MIIRIYTIKDYVLLSSVQVEFWCNRDLTKWVIIREGEGGNLEMGTEWICKGEIWKGVFFHNKKLTTNDKAVQWEFHSYFMRLFQASDALLGLNVSKLGFKFYYLIIKNIKIWSKYSGDHNQFKYLKSRKQFDENF